MLLVFPEVVGPFSVDRRVGDAVVAREELQCSLLEARVERALLQLGESPVVLTVHPRQSLGAFHLLEPLEWVRRGVLRQHGSRHQGSRCQSGCGKPKSLHGMSFCDICLGVLNRQSHIVKRSRTPANSSDHCCHKRKTQFFAAKKYHLHSILSRFFCLCTISAIYCTVWIHPNIFNSS